MSKIEEDQLKETFTAYLEWLKQEVLTKKLETSYQKVAVKFGIVSGVLSSAVTVPLGYDFGIWLAKQAGIMNPASRIFISTYFGSTSFIPIAALSARTTKEVFKNLVTKTSAQEKRIKIQEKKHIQLIKALYYTYIAVSGAVTAAADVYNTYQKFSDYMALWSLTFMIPDAISGTVVFGWAYDNFNTKIFKQVKSSVLNQITPAEASSIRALRLRLENQLKQAERIIAAMSTNEINEMVNLVFFQDEKEQQALDARDKLKLLFYPSTLPNYIDKPLFKTSAVQKLVGCVGGVIGLLAGLIYEPLGEGAADTILATAANEKFFGIATVFCRSALMAYASFDSFEKFYAWFIKLPKHMQNLVINIQKLCHCEAISDKKTFLRNGLNLLTIFISFTSTAPRAEIVVENNDTQTAYAQLLLVCAVLGTFATRFWSLNTALNEMFDGNSERSKLMGAITKMLNMVSRLDDRIIIQLAKELDLYPDQEVVKTGMSVQEGSHCRSGYAPLV